MAEELPPSPGVAALAAVPPQVHVLPAGAHLLRIWFRDARHPSGFALFRTFGPTASRFDHHLPGPGGEPVSGGRGILYTMEEGTHSFEAALAEMFQDTRTIDLVEEAPIVSVFETRRDLRLLDLTGLWATRVGASAAISSGSRERAREWSRDFHEAYPTIDGLRYRSSMSGGGNVAMALYERAIDAMPTQDLVRVPLGHPEMRREVVDVAERIGYEVVP